MTARAVRPSSGGRAADGGGASILAVALVGLAAVLAVAVAGVAHGAGIREHAQIAADASALAGALAARDARATGNAPAVPGCRSAREAAARNGARVVACSVSRRGDVAVTVRLEDGAAGAVGAGARAGSRP